MSSLTRSDTRCFNGRYLTSLARGEAEDGLFELQEASMNDGFIGMQKLPIDNAYTNTRASRKSMLTDKIAGEVDRE